MEDLLIPGTGSVVHLILTIFLVGTAADRQERCSPANFLAYGLDEDQWLHVKCPVSGCRVMATRGPRFLVMETSRRRAAANGAWPFDDEVDAVVLLSFMLGGALPCRGCCVRPGPAW